MTTQMEDRCRACGGPVLPVLWGMPGPEAMEAAGRGELIIGGCMPEDVEFRCECGATAYDVDGRRIRPFTIDDARRYIAEVRWQFAKTMPQWPHEYTVRDWRADLEDDFLAFVELIRAEGVVKPWPADSPRPRYHHTYLAVDGWDYWTMGEPVEDTEVINRARLGSGRANIPRGYSNPRITIAAAQAQVALSGS